MAIDKLVEEINSKLGEEIHLSDWQLVDQEMIDGFAHVTKDHPVSNTHLTLPTTPYL